MQAESERLLGYVESGTSPTRETVLRMLRDGELGPSELESSMGLGEFVFRSYSVLTGLGTSVGFAESAEEASNHLSHEVNRGDGEFLGVVVGPGVAFLLEVQHSPNGRGGSFSHLARVEVPLVG